MDRTDDKNSIPWNPDSDLAELPTVALPGGGTKVRDAAEELGRLLGTTGRFFARGLSVSRLDKEPDAAPCLILLKPAHFPSAFESVADLVRVSRDSEGNIVEKPATCSESNARLIINAEQFVNELPRIRVLTNCPVLIERENQLLEITDYDRRSGILAGGWATEELSLDDAVALLKEMHRDFQFATPPDQSRAAAAVITPALVFGGLLGGRSPIDLGEADKSQTGKGFRNKLIAAIYGHTVKTVTQRKGGVGSLEEEFDTALISGSPFVSLDNIRDKLDSPAIESFLTEDQYQARMPHSAAVSIDPRRVLVMLTSNRAALTDDMANRCSCVRILKQVDGYQFAAYSEGNILDHVRANRRRYLGAVFAVIRAWYAQGQLETDTADHDFREWSRKLDWIVKNLMGLPLLLGGHRTIQKRMTNPALNWLRDVAILVLQKRRDGEWLRPYQILDELQDSDLRIPGHSDGKDLADDVVRNNVLQSIGRQLKKCFDGESKVIVDKIEIERAETRDDHHRPCIEYCFTLANTQGEKHAQTPEPRYDPADPANESDSFFCCPEEKNNSFIGPSGLAGLAGLAGWLRRLKTRTWMSERST